MTNAEINEAMVQDLVDFLKQYNVFTGTMIFYNGKLMKYDYKTKEIVTKEDMDVKEYTEFCNPDMVTLIYEGDDSPYKALNWYVHGEEEEAIGNEIIDGFGDIGEKYNRWYDLGSETCLYYYPEEESSLELHDFHKYYFPRNKE